MYVLNFKVLVEIPINDRLIPADRRTRGGHNRAHKHIRANTTLGQNSFWHRTIPDWNSLPAAAIESKTVAAFKSQLVDKICQPLPPPSSLILHNGGLLEYSIKVKFKSENKCDDGSKRVNLPNSSKFSFLLSPLAIILRSKSLQRYMITTVCFFMKGCPLDSINNDRSAAALGSMRENE